MSIHDLFHGASFIWLDKNAYKDYQKNPRTIAEFSGDEKFVLAEFLKEFSVDEPVKKAELFIFGDTAFRFYLNEEYVGSGPVSAGGDFSVTFPPIPSYYSRFEIYPQQGKNSLRVEVQNLPLSLIQSSKGQGGLILACNIELESGEIVRITTDKSWLSRKKNIRREACLTTYKEMPAKYIESVEIENVWTLKPSPIENLTEEYISPEDYIIFDQYKDRVLMDGDTITLKNGCPLTFFVKFPMIVAAYTSLDVEGCADIILGCQEILGKPVRWIDSRETLITKGNIRYRGLRLQSIGYIQLTVSFLSKEDVVLKNLGIISVHYPIHSEGSFKCSDDELNKIYSLCKHTLKICRNTLHLDSPLHQEHLACTGDYLIQSLMAYYAYGDGSLTRFDIVRTCDHLRMNDGLMFHTNYSLMLIRMIMDYVKYTGDISIMSECVDAIDILLKRFEGYLSKDGFIDNAPNYMFVDHLERDGYTLHYPPLFMGQAVLNAFYYMALCDAADMYGMLNNFESANKCKRGAEKVKKCFNELLWDRDKQLYFDGEPREHGKKYFSVHANTLAVLFGLADEKVQLALMKRTLSDPAILQPQPYFMHFVFEAIFKVGLQNEYFVEQIKRWTALVDECDMGLKEVWSYMECDYSHAWGGTPAYQLPSKMLGLEILENGFKKISIKPELFGIEWAKIKVPTPFGYIEAELYSNGKNKITVPEGIEVVPHS